MPPRGNFMSLDLETDGGTFEDPALLWHYTSFDAFINIVKEKQMWATHTGHLNDYTEGVPIGVFARMRMAELVNANTVPERSASLRKLALSLREFRGENFVICFSAAGDRLDNWRSYLRGGRGVALGFTQTALAQWAPFTLDRVRYAPPEELQKEFDAVADRFLAALQTIDHERTFLEMDAWLYEWAARLKDRAFREEQEWRLFLHPGKAPRPTLYRSGPTGVVPYVLGPKFEPSAIDEVRLAPGTSEEQRESVERFLSEHGFGLAARHVVHSAVPWRAV